MGTWMVYMLRCADGSLYTGVTCDLSRRLLEHNAGKSQCPSYTRGRLPVSLAYCEKAASRSAALKREAAIKRLNRKDKLALLQSFNSNRVTT